MDVNIDIVVKIVVPVVTLLSGIVINRILESKEKLVVYLGHAASHKLERVDDQPQVIVNTHSVVLRNNGSKSAQNVRLGHNQLPSVNVFPDIEYEIKDLPGGGKEMVFPVIVPKKEVTISYLYYEPVRWQSINTHIESDEGPAKVVSVLLQKQPKLFALILVGFLMFMGAVSTIYLFIGLVKWYAM